MILALFGLVYGVAALMYAVVWCIVMPFVWTFKILDLIWRWHEQRRREASWHPRTSL